ncbi:MAG: outer membrane beta-barrel protein [Planctomycetaceae bacterium]|nr:outer membrane beta-barrel protein [Planctomycetaceae bacterium]MCA9044134.1 outer membrane beta-barrel protein [Planctomycetaceae bacterium]MCB9951779.1 outer membrane beta-barrel protein [Planctomycetaceae bacterium]
MRRMSFGGWLLSVAAVLGLATTASAQDDLPFENFDLGESLFGEESSIDVGGWMQFGYHSDNDAVFNTHPGSLDLQQFNLFIEKVADGSEGLDWGGRMDVMYGTDAPNTQAFGNNPGNWDFQNGFDHGIYGFAIPQLYGEVAYEDLSVKVGHFYTLLGYQVVPATGNFFYSIPYTFNYSEAFTHTGVLATYKVNDDITAYGGWTLGWDTGYDQLGNGNSFLGGASLALTDDVSATFITTFGDLGWIGDGYSHSLVVDYNINDDWEYVFQSDYISVNNSPNTKSGDYDTFGVNQYLFYNIADDVRAGFRGEWWKADGISLYEVAFGLNLSPLNNLLIRPEVRYNWAAGSTQLPDVISGLGIPSDDIRDNAVFGVDAILTF